MDMIRHGLWALLAMLCVAGCRDWARVPSPPVRLTLLESSAAAAGAEGAPCWKVFWPQCHTERAYQDRNAFGQSGFPFNSKEYANSESVDYSKVDVPNAVWHQSHTFTCFAYPTFSEEDCQQIGQAVAKVIKAYAK